jgi:(E)-4-hydroxy-3-methylbut-2-enyl-diphosphate synthase
VEKLAREVEALTCGINKRIVIAVMGCVVNGLGEGASADIGVAGGKEKSVIFKKGAAILTVPNDQILPQLKKLLSEL